MAGGIEEGVQVLERRLALQRLLAAGTANRIDDLVLQDAGEPGAELRPPGEALLRGERRDECFLNCILGSLPVAKLQRGEAQQIRPLRFDLLP